MIWLPAQRVEKLFLMPMIPVSFAMEKPGEGSEKNAKELSQSLSLNKFNFIANTYEIVCFGATTDTPDGRNSFKETGLGEIFGIYRDKILKFRYNVSQAIRSLTCFCGTVCKLQNYLSRKHLLIFNELYAKFIIFVGILMYDENQSNFIFKKTNSEGDILHEEIQLCIKNISRIRTPQFSCFFCELFKRVREGSCDDVALPIAQLSSRRASHLQLFNPSRERTKTPEQPITNNSFNVLQSLKIQPAYLKF